MARKKRRILGRPATTAHERENQLISHAYDLAEQQLVEGTASSQVMTHFLKMGATRESLEQERLRNENLVLEAKARGMQSAQRVEELYEQALNAMRAYSGDDVYDEYED